MKDDYWKLLQVFTSDVRVKILRLLLEFEWRSLSEIAQKLEAEHGLRITLPGLLKHMRELEGAGLVRRESGVYAREPDARKTLYILEGKERVAKIMKSLEELSDPFLAGVYFSETADLARKIQGVGSKGVNKEDVEKLLSLIEICESERIYGHLTEDERKKIKLWKMMIKIL